MVLARLLSTPWLNMLILIDVCELFLIDDDLCGLGVCDGDDDDDVSRQIEN